RWARGPRCWRRGRGGRRASGRWPGTPPPSWMEALPLVDAGSPAVMPPPSWDTDRLVTYSRSITVDLTYRCLARCGYCEYRKDKGGLVSTDEVEQLLDRAVAERCREVLVMSGERPWELTDLGITEDDFISLAVDVSRRAMRRGLLPH